MQLVYFLLASVALATAQNLTSVLSSNNNLSTLSTLISADRELLRTLESADNVTILAPSNKAIVTFLEDGNLVANALFCDGRLTQALVRYHILNGRYLLDSITETGMIIPTLLTDDAYTNVSGGQVIQAIRTSSHSQNTSEISEGKVEFYSGYNAKSTVEEPDIMFNGGLIHIIDSILVIPDNVTATSLAAGLTSLVGAVRETDFHWDEWENATFFAPNNEAFQAVSSELANMTKEELHTTLMYHVINDTLPIYTTTIDHADWITTTGTNITFTLASDGTIFVNSAAIVQPNILVANGVIHVVDNVLNPNGTSTSTPSGPSGAPGFENASPTNGPPFTSGVPSATTTVGSGPALTPTAGWM